MKLNKLFLAGASAIMMMAASSCVNDLDIKPNDPNYPTPEARNVFLKCYSGLAVSGQGGPNGGCDINGVDGGRSQYARAIFMMNVFPTDEAKWIWKDDGIYDLNTLTFGASNVNVYGTYSRFYSHIAVCNDFIRTYKGSDDPEIQKWIVEARALRALSYYWVIDIFGNASFVTEEDAIGSEPEQKDRVFLYNWLSNEIEDLVSTWKSKYANDAVEYGRIGLDAIQALASRLYLNGMVYAGDAGCYAKAQAHCEDIIGRHKGKGGFNNSGLAKHFLYLFCRTNSVYTPGGGNAAENEILWGVPADDVMTQSYGGAFFIIAASTSSSDSYKGGEAGQPDSYNMYPLNYGTNASWTCMHATAQLADKFTDPNDVRTSLWLREESGFSKENTTFSQFNCGYASLKFTSLIAGTNGEWSPENGGIYDPTGKTPANVLNWSSTDWPMFRLADTYLTYAECYILGHTGDAAKAVEYVNYVRNRAGLSSWYSFDLTADNILDERCRETYWENTRRSDLIRHNKFTGSNYVWAWKGDSFEGAAVDSRYNLMPIPTNIIAAQPYFQQNPGY